jgi:uncharacterized protein YqhQ
MEYTDQLSVKSIIELSFLKPKCATEFHFIIMFVNVHKNLK